MAADNTYQTGIQIRQGANEMAVASGATVTIESGGTLAVASGAALTGKQVRHTARSVWFNLDNGAGTTIDDVILVPASAITITAVRAVYVDETTGTVAAATFSVGTTVGGTEIVAATAYENNKTVGTATAGTIVSGAVAAGTPVCVRHTGVAATAAGQAVIEIDYTIDA